MRYSTIRESLIHPGEVHPVSKVLANIRSLPNKAGIYGWYFRFVAEFAFFKGCVVFQDEVMGDMWLGYLGIAQGAEGTRTFRGRFRDHLKKDASRSTLRKSAGSLLSEHLGLLLVPDHNGRPTFGDGELSLTNWLSENAFVSVVPCDQPELYEKTLIRDLAPPLNIQHNTTHPFYAELKRSRAVAGSSSGAIPQF
jgi:hypothetical protein